MKTCPEVPRSIVANVKRTFSVPWGHSVFNGTQLTIYRTRYGRLTRAENTLRYLSLARNALRKLFFSSALLLHVNGRPLYGFYVKKITMQPPPRKVSFFPLRCNLAVQANVTCLKRSRRTGAYLMGGNVRFVAVTLKICSIFCLKSFVGLCSFL